MAAVTVVALCLVLAGWWMFRNAEISEARMMIPEIARLADDQQLTGAYRLAVDAERILGDDPALARLWPRVSRTISVQTDPAAADVYVRDYSDTGNDWDYLGRTPLEGARIPLQHSRWRIEKDGYEPIEVADRRDARREGRQDDFSFKLHAEGTSPPGMVRLDGGNIQGVRLGTYYIDRHEVTNRQFKEFLEAGGYRNRQYWTTGSTSTGSTVSWSQMEADFRDKTGRPGPATWSLGTYPDGQDDYPVGGVSWHEAKAYAQWAGKELPTLYHWLHAAKGAWNYMVPMSLIGKEGPGPVGSSEAISAYGVCDVAGNVREWSSTPFGNQQLILGGAWNQPGYYFHNHRAANPLDRSTENGFRCATYVEPLSDNATVPVALELRDYSNERPVDDDTFEVYRRLLSYDRTALNERVESVDESAEHWLKEKVTFDAAYGDERLTAYLFVPRRTDPPYQTVIYFPGSGAERVDSSERLRGVDRIEPIVRSGRAVLYPVYKGTYERRLDGKSSLGLDLFGDTTKPTVRRDVAIMAARDVSRSVDYLEVRKDIRADQVGYVGYSLGSRMAPLFLATEKRIQAAVLAHGGLYQAPKSTRMPEVDEINFAPRVTQPVLMLNGRFDFSFSVDNSQRPLYELLGTAQADKKHVLFDGGHGAFFTNDQIREMLDWFDRYLGEVR
jgi:dienelactone hydrolase